MCASIMLSPRTRRANTSSPWPASADGATGSSPSTSSLARFGEPAAMRPRIGTGLNWRVPMGTVGVSAREVRPALGRRWSAPLRSSARRWSNAARGVTLNRSPISRTVGGTPCRTVKCWMKPRTSRCRAVSSRMWRPPVTPNNTQRVLSMSSKKRAPSGRLPRLAHGARDVALLACVGDVLEVQTLGLGDPRGPCALGPVEEARTALRAERLGGRGRGRGGRSVGSGKRLGGGWHGRRRGRRRFDRRHARRRSDGIEVVQVQVCLDGLAELVARAAELTHRAADHPPELRELRGAEDEQRDHPDDEHFLEPDVEHGRTLEYHRREPPFEPSRLAETYATPATRASSAKERTTRSASGADAPPAGAYRTVRIPSCRAPLISDATLSPTIAVAADSSPRRSSAIRKSGGSGFPTTTGRTPAATATASTSAPHPGRNSPPSSGSRGATFGVTSGAPAAAARAAAGSRSYVRSKSLPPGTTVGRRESLVSTSSWAR